MAHPAALGQAPHSRRGGGRRAVRSRRSTAGRILLPLLVLGLLAGCTPQAPAKVQTGSSTAAGSSAPGQAGSSAAAVSAPSGGAPTASGSAAGAPVWQSGGDLPGNGSPFAVSFGYPTGAEAGQPVSLTVQVTQPGGPSSGATLAAPLPLRVAIYRAAQVSESGGVSQWVEHGPAVWQTALPPLTTVKPGWGAVLHLSWDERDAQGRQVPPGVYLADLQFPHTLAYQVGGVRSDETLPTTPLTARDQYYREPVFVGAANAPYGLDPRIAALASEMHTTIYVPGDIAGHPQVLGAGTFAPPPLPNAPDRQGTNAMITFGSALVEILVTAPMPLPHGDPGEQPVSIGVGGGITGVVYQDSINWSAPGGPTYGYQLDMDIGRLFVELETSHYNEGQLIAIGKSIVPVVAVEPA